MRDNRVSIEDLMWRIAQYGKKKKKKKLQKMEYERLLKMRNSTSYVLEKR
jgi:hypothetical protein